LLRNKLTRSLPHLFPSAIDELDHAFRDELTSKLYGQEWTALAPAQALTRVICRATNRLLVGIPLCRDKEYIDLCVKYTRQIGLSSLLIMQFPSFLKPYVSRFLTPLSATYARAERLMADVIAQRKNRDEAGGGGADDKPDDYLQWLLDAGDSHPKEPHAIAARLLGLNFVALSTTSLSFIYALYHVAAEPEKYQEPIRREVDEIVSHYGWTTEALQRMRKLNSLMREVQRFHGHRDASVVMDRKAMQDYTFSDGTAVRKGETVCVPAHATHLDDAVYPRAATFNGFRFYDAEEHEGLYLPNRLIATSTEFLAFGMGKHACPGRFWAATEMKAMLAYMLVHYDVKMERDGVIPAGTYLGGALVPDTSARVLFRKRDPAAY
ncbi:cytochrome P450, partial [Auricularia subglabra TFB-10046 SS5]